MSSETALEQRLNDLEQIVASLQCQVAAQQVASPQPQANSQFQTWLEKLIGSVSDEAALPIINLQEKVEQWAEAQGISPEDLIKQALAEKLQQLQQQSLPIKTEAVTPHSTRLRRKNGVLILETDSDPAIDINAWIEELREERIQEQMAL
jgi:hypothetical protein